MKVFLLHTEGTRPLPEAYRRAAQAQLEVGLQDRLPLPDAEVLFLRESQHGPTCPVLEFGSLKGDLVLLPAATAIKGEVCWSCNRHCQGQEGITAADVSPARCEVRFWWEIPGEARLRAPAEQG